MSRPDKPPMVIPGHPHEAVSLMGMQRKFDAVKLAFQHGAPLAYYPARWQGKRVVCIALMLGENTLAPMALLLDDEDLAEVDVSETQTIEGLVVDDTRIN